MPAITAHGQRGAFLYSRTYRRSRGARPPDGPLSRVTIDHRSTLTRALGLAITSAVDGRMPSHDHAWGYPITRTGTGLSSAVALGESTSQHHSSHYHQIDAVPAFTPSTAAGWTVMIRSRWTGTELNGVGAINTSTFYIAHITTTRCRVSLTGLALQTSASGTWPTDTWMTLFYQARHNGTDYTYEMFDGGTSLVSTTSGGANSISAAQWRFGAGYSGFGETHQTNVWAAWRRALSTDEMAYLKTNPWAIFTTAPTVFDMHAPAAGGLSIPIASHHYRTMTAA